MSNHIEWAEARYATRSANILSAEQAEAILRPDEGATLPVLVLDTGSSALAIEGDLPALAALGRRIIALVEEHTADAAEQADLDQDALDRADAGR